MGEVHQDFIKFLTFNDCLLMSSVFLHLKKKAKKQNMFFPIPCIVWNSKNKGAVVSTIQCIIQIVGLDFVSASCISFLEFMKKSFILQGNWNEFVPLPYRGNTQLNLFDQQHYQF